MVDIHTSGPLRLRPKPAGFSLVEVMVAMGVLIVGISSVFVLNSQVVNTLRRGTSGSFASQLIQERMEQFRRAAWTEITSNYPPNEEDPADIGYDSDADDNGENYVDDVYPTEFPYDLEDLDSLSPGLKEVMAIVPASAAQLPNLKERVTVEAYNASNKDITIFDANGSSITLGPFDVGGTPIVVERENGVVTTVTHNAVMVLNTTVRLTLQVSWKGSDGITRTKESVTLFTVEGDK
ncbi:MAG TPA: type II secretion system protein [Chthoniobacterales bacterium]|nr:type II secretion system protein [Chthoniobacterales bacterium]